MAFCRFGKDSELYVFEAWEGFECMLCDLVGRRTFRAPDAAGMANHLLEHRAAGHRFRESALDELRMEAGLPLEGEQGVGIGG